jgi:HD-GYP domain-containing protein (c-di-GMP phosphodiesterase class II)
MNPIPVSVDFIRVGHPLPCNLVDKDGVLLARKSFVIKSKEDLIDISNRGGGLFTDGADAEMVHRSYREHLQSLIQEEAALGVIAEARFPTDPSKKKSAGQGDAVDWLDIIEQANFLLRDTNPVTFRERLEHIDATILREIQRNADAALFALISISAAELRKYSATHGLLVSVMCGIASREVLNWPEPIQAVLRKAGLAMNVAMTDLQDKLALQLTAPDQAQKQIIADHARQSAALLNSLGVSDLTLLEAVREHHTQTPGPLRAKAPAHRLARLIQRADMFAARLAPRSARKPITPAAAMQACYFDENKQVDEAGAALIKAVGIYQPGSFVKLATQEVAVVVRRAANTSTPKVAVMVNRDGIASAQPMIRDTSMKEYRVVASIPRQDIKIQLNLGRMLPLTQQAASDRPW